MDEKRSMKKFRIVIVTISFLFFLTVFLFSVFVFFYKLENKGENSEDELERYQYLLLDPSRNSTSRGLVTIPQLENEERFLTQRFDGKYMVISEFGMKEYQCIGRCICEKNRRANVITFSRSIFTIIASVTFVLAHNKARTFFDQTCASKIADECSPDESVRSEIDSCEEIVSSERSDSKRSDNRIAMICWGRCRVRKALAEHHSKGIKPFGVLRLECGDINLRERIWVEYSEADDMSTIEKRAEEKFVRDYMEDLCKRESTFRAEITVKKKWSPIGKYQQICVPQEDHILCWEYDKNTDKRRMYWEDEDFEEYEREMKQKKKEDEE